MTPGTLRRKAIGGTAVVLAFIVAVGARAWGCYVEPPVVELEPASGPPGASVTVVGRNWRSSSVAIVWDATGQRLGTAAPDQSGSFRVVVAVPSSASPGSFLVKAVPSSTGITYQEETGWAPFEVTQAPAGTTTTTTTTTPAAVAVTTAPPPEPRTPAPSSADSSSASSPLPDPGSQAAEPAPRRNPLALPTAGTATAPAPAPLVAGTTSALVTVSPVDKLVAATRAAAAEAVPAPLVPGGAEPAPAQVTQPEPAMAAPPATEKASEPAPPARRVPAGALAGAGGSLTLVSGLALRTWRRRRRIGPA